MRIHHSKLKIAIPERAGITRIWLALVAAIIGLIVLTNSAGAWFPSSEARVGGQHRSPAQAGPRACGLDFSLLTSYPVGTGPASVGTGDFNNDGYPDLAVANANGGSNDVSVRLNDGSGGFGAASSFAVGLNPSSVATADFDNDGNLDLVTANAGSNDVSVLLGDGNGNFAVTSGYFAGSNPQWIAVGDFNEDGNPDLVTAAYGTSDVTVLYGDGSGAFNTSVNFATGSHPRSVAVADFDSDGHLDLATANGGSGDVAVLLGDGSGDFGSPTNFPAGTIPYSLAVGDFNGDNHPDLAVANNGSESVSVLLGDGSGGFTPTPDIAAPGNPSSVAVADFNSDGHLDLEYTSYFGNIGTVLPGDGTGSFDTNTGVSFSAGPTPQHSAAADFDGDGKPDLAFANYSSDQVTVALNRCTPTPTVTPTSIYTATNTPTSTITPTPTITFTPLPTSTLVGAWTIVASCPIHVYGNAVVMAGGRTGGPANNIYSIGGYVNGQVSNLVYTYNVVTNAWTRVADLPIPLASARAVTNLNKIFVFGGISASQTRLPTAFVYNPFTDTWTQLANMPDARQSPDVAYVPNAVGGLDMIYVMGGFSDLGGVTGTEESQTWQYNVNFNSWATKASIPAPMAASATTHVGNYIYLMGSRGTVPGRFATRLHYRYNFVTDTWEARALLPVPTLGAYAGPAPNYIVLFGGQSDTNPPAYHTASYVYDIPSDSWRLGTNMNEEHGVGGGTIGSVTVDHLYIVGGLKGPNADVSNTVETTQINIGPTATPTSTQTTSPSNTPTRTNTPTITPTRTSTPLPVLVGHVIWQGISQPNANNVGITATLTLCVAGSPQTFVAPTNSSGSFTVTLALAPGQYNWQVKGVRNLSNAGNLTLLAGTTNYDFGLQRAGDVNNNNIVNTTDFNLLRGQIGQSGPGKSADFNNDGVVNTTDFNLLRNNFGQAGSLLTCP